MTVAITPNETWLYVLPADRDLPKDEQTRYKLKRLSRGEVLEFRRLRISDETGIEAEDYAIRHGLIGWSNLKDESGAEVKFDSEDMDKNLEHLNPWLVAPALSMAIITGDKLEEDEVKNLSSPGT